jgi:hypothetical protein
MHECCERVSEATYMLPVLTLMSTHVMGYELFDV